jgi:protein-S-isoprenylcysteine O-methyltransferase Ste14
MEDRVNKPMGDSQKAPRSKIFWKRADLPSILAPVPWIAFAALGVGLLVDRIWWIGVIGTIPRPFRATLALTLVIAGLLFILFANIAFYRAKTPFQPWIPSRALADSGIYALTRNPMYQGFFIVTLGLGTLLRSDWTAILLVPAAILVHFGVVLREERYLAQRFGDAYRAYCAAVPRYGWALRRLVRSR